MHLKAGSCHCAVDMKRCFTVFCDAPSGCKCTSNHPPLAFPFKRAEASKPILARTSDAPGSQTALLSEADDQKALPWVLGFGGL